MKDKRIVLFSLIFLFLIFGNEIRSEAIREYPITESGFLQLVSDLESDKIGIQKAAEKALAIQFREMESFFYSKKDLSPEAARIFNVVRDEIKEKWKNDFRRSFSLHFLKGKIQDQPVPGMGSEKTVMSLRMKIEWPESFCVQHILLDQSKIRFLDHRGNEWFPLSKDVRREIFLDPGKNECEWEIKLIQEKKGSDPPAKIKDPVRGRLKVGCSVLGGMDERILVFPYLLKRRFSEKIIERGDLKLTLLKEDREGEKIVLRIGIDYDNPFDLFESHRNYIHELDYFLIRYDPDGKQIRGENPLSIEPVRSCEKGVVVDLVFDRDLSPGGRKTDSVDLMLRIPVFIFSSDLEWEIECLNWFKKGDQQ